MRAGATTAALAEWATALAECATVVGAALGVEAVLLLGIVRVLLTATCAAGFTAATGAVLGAAAHPEAIPAKARLDPAATAARSMERNWSPPVPSGLLTRPLTLKTDGVGPWLPPGGSR
jgi:hypothetical protein